MHFELSSGASDTASETNRNDMLDAGYTGVVGSAEVQENSNSTLVQEVTSSIEEELHIKVQAHQNKHPGGTLPTELRSLEAFKMFKVGTPGWLCRP